MDKLIGVAIFIGLILFLLSEILPIIAIIAGFAILVFFVIKMVSAIQLSRKKKFISFKCQISFLEGLSKYSGKTYLTPSKVKELNQLIIREFDDYCNSCTIDSRVSVAFENLMKDVRSLYFKCSSWVCSQIHTTGLYSDIYGSSIDRIEIMPAKNVENLPLEITKKAYLSLQIGEKYLILFPFFIVFVNGEKVSFINYENATLSKIEQINVEENVFYGIKGATPLYYRYLHERVDGGPDRRYNYNPSTPVYCYSKQKLDLGNSQYLITSNKSCGSSLMNSLQTFQNTLKTFPISTSLDVSSFDVSKDEVASVFKDIFSSYGKEVVLKKLFISVLEDYKITRKRIYLKPILNKIADENLWGTILDETCSFETLNNIKNILNASNQFEMRDITETLAYLGYGLQLKRV